MAPPKRKKLEKSPNEGAPLSSQKFYCCRCGTAYGRLKGYFPASHSPMYRGTNYLPFCSTCLDDLFDKYKEELGDGRKAMKRICMKIDLYWSDLIYDMVERNVGINSKVRNYIGKSNMIRFVNKTYDDTILEEIDHNSIAKHNAPDVIEIISDVDVDEDEVHVEESVILFWGPGYTNQKYHELEKRKMYWISRYPKGYKFDLGEEALLRQICSLEIDINFDRAAGRATDKNVNTLNTLLGSANLKPTQKKSEDSDSELESMALGVGIQKWENSRPLPETPKNKKDIRGTIKNITTWYFGHVCKMIGLKNSYCEMYENAMEDLRVNNQEFEDYDDDALLSELFDGARLDGE